jgi:hypothetical protein
METENRDNPNQKREKTQHATACEWARSADERHMSPCHWSTSSQVGPTWRSSVGSGTHMWHVAATH